MQQAGLSGTTHYDWSHQVLASLGMQHPLNLQCLTARPLGVAYLNDYAHCVVDSEQQGMLSEAVPV